MNMHHMTQRLTSALSSPVATAFFRVGFAIITALIALCTWSIIAWLNGNYARAEDLRTVKSLLEQKIEERKADVLALDRRLIRIEEKQQMSGEQITRVLDRVEKIGDRLGVPASAK